MPLISTVVIDGVGLIGGSFALALRKSGFQGEILGVGSPQTIQRSTELGVIDRGVSLQEGASKADLFYFAQPISRILEHVPLISGLTKTDALITDAGSTKAEIVACAGRFLPAGSFLGGHPMAGKESRGVESAEPGLFRGRTYILTPARAEEMHRPIVREFLELVENVLGSRTMIIGPEVHDHVLAYTSHLAQMASTALSWTVLERIPEPAHRSTAGPGLQDMSRLALSSYEIWKDIISTNSCEIQAALDHYIEALCELRSILVSDQVSQVFEKASILARSIRSQSSKSVQN